MEEKISALIAKRARATLRITQSNSQSFSVKSFTESKLPKLISKSRKCQTPSPIWVVDQDQLNPYVANEGYVVRTLHNPLSLSSSSEISKLLLLISLRALSVWTRCFFGQITFYTGYRRGWLFSCNLLGHKVFSLLD